MGLVCDERSAGFHLGQQPIPNGFDPVSNLPTTAVMGNRRIGESIEIVDEEARWIRLIF